MDRRKFLVGLGSLAAGGAAASGTGAFTAAKMDRDGNVNVVDDGDALIALRPGGARGVGDRVAYDGNGELNIDLVGSGSGSGVNDEARYQLGAMNDDDPLGDGITFTSIYDDDSTPEAAGDGEPYVVSSRTDGPKDQSAFVVENHSGQTLDLEIGWELDDASNLNPNGATIYLQGKASAISGDAPSGQADRLDGATAIETTSVDLEDTDTDPANEELSFNNGNESDEAIPAGEAVYVSLQVDSTDDDTSGSIDLGGRLVVNANEAADPGTD